ncbi:MAG: LytTR family transcriptional regulator DNA-binding domain-containing protein [Lysobacterales bacterium]
MTAGYLQKFSTRTPGLLGLSALLGIAVAALAPAGTDQLTVPSRGIFWVAQICVGAALCWALERLWIRRRIPALPTLPLIAICAVGASLVYTPFAWQMEVEFGLSQPSNSRLTDWFQEWRQLVVAFVGCWLLLRSRIRPDFGHSESRTGPATFSPVPAKDSVEPTASTPDALSSDGKFWQQLPDNLGRSLLWVRAEEHYLRVATTEGKALIRCGFRYAMENALDSVQGLQVHRSYWVAEKQVRRLLKKQQNWFCEMTDGAIIPVSRRRRAAVRASLAAHAVYPQSGPPKTQSNQ